MKYLGYTAAFWAPVLTQMVVKSHSQRDPTSGRTLTAYLKVPTEEKGLPEQPPSPAASEAQDQQ